MRILIVGRRHAAEIRGATIVTHGLARALAARGHRVTLLASARPEHRVQLDGVAMRYVDVERKSLYPVLFGLLRRGDHDVVHAQDESAGLLALRGRLLGLPMVAHLHPPRVHAEGFVRAGWRWRWIGLAARHAPLVAVPSRWLADALAARYALDERRLRAIPNGIGDAWFEVRELRGARAPAALRVALVNMKGVEVALRAFAKLAPEHPASLELYGTHPDVPRWRALAAELGIGERVTFCGFVPNAELPRRVAGADLLLHPTESESFGQVLGEAAALGLPVVTSRVGAVPEIVEHEVTGLLCSAGDVEGFARALRELAAAPELRARLGAAARARAESRWRWSAVAARFEDEVYAPLALRSA
jgi:glycosyltransferase involved in cell wall biosynthesis